MLQKQGKLKESERAFENLLSLYEVDIKDKSRLAITWNSLGKVLQEQGKFMDAEQAFLEEIAIAKKLDDKSRLAIGWNCLGRLLQQEGKLEEAKQAFEIIIRPLLKLNNAAVGLSGKLSDTSTETRQDAKYHSFPLVVAWALHNLGVIYKSKRELETAEKFFKESREIFKDKNSLPGLKKVMNTLGSVLEKRQKWKEVKAVLKESYVLAEELRDKLGKAIVANKLGQVIARLEEDEAFMYFNESMKLGEELNNKRHLAQVYTARGKVFLKRELNARAFQEFSQGFEIIVELGNIKDLKIITPKITYVLYRLGRQKEALAYCERALEIAPDHTSFQQ